MNNKLINIKKIKVLSIIFFIEKNSEKIGIFSIFGRKWIRKTALMEINGARRKMILLSFSL